MVRYDHILACIETSVKVIILHDGKWLLVTGKISLKTVDLQNKNGWY